jgi:hypothetical protein
MTVRPRVLVLVLGLALAVTARAAEAPEAHADKPHKTIYLGKHRIEPSNLTMVTDDVLVLQNDAIQPIRVTFVEPKDIEQKIRCALLEMPATQRPPWGIFSLENGVLTGLVPPGRFASVCSLSPGKYSFVAKVVDAEAAAGASTELQEKATITVR